MKTIILKFDYLNLKIEKSINLVEIINSMPPALRVETIIDILSTLDSNILLEDLQKAIFKKRVNHINKLLSVNSVDIFNNKIWIDK
jgi:hypothetical protein